MPKPRRDIPRVETATLSFQMILDDARMLNAVRQAVGPEFHAASHERCSVSLSEVEKNEASILELQFAAADLTSLRASMNVNLRLILSSLKTLNMAADSEGRNAE
jgi:tRNA threonylcarbamoyladenosine modification (KEOPS) complex  Pcc1 subunit